MAIFHCYVGSPEGNTMIIYYIETYLRSSAQAMAKQIPDLLWQATDRHEAKILVAKIHRKLWFQDYTCRKCFKKGRSLTIFRIFQSFHSPCHKTLQAGYGDVCRNALLRILCWYDLHIYDQYMIFPLLSFVSIIYKQLYIYIHHHYIYIYSYHHYIYIYH